jgi:hypothetical protein
MAYNQISCTTSFGNTGLACGTENLEYFAKLIFTTEDFEFESQTTAETESEWTDAINEKTVFPFKNFVTVENSSEENVREELPTGVVAFVRKGKYRETGFAPMALCEMIEHQKFTNKKGRVFLVTANGYILGYTPDGTTLKGFSIDTLEVGNLGPTDGSTQRRVGVYYSLANPDEMGLYVGAIAPTWNPLDLEGLVNVDVEVSGSPTSSLVTFTVKTACEAEDVTGLVEDDFLFLDAVGDAQTGQTFAEVGSGVYTFSSSAETVTGTLDLADPDDQTTGGYESSGEATVTIIIT